MKKLDESSLKVGDIILTTTTAAVSKAIRTATRSDISHAMISVADHSVIDATAEGVQSGRVLELIGDRLPADAPFAAIGANIATRAHLRTLVRSPRAFVLGIPGMYARFRREALREGRHYRRDDATSAFLAGSRIAPEEVDVLLLAMLRNARRLLQYDRRILVLRHQLNVLRRQLSRRPQLSNSDRFLFVWLYRWFPSVLGAIAILRPETIIRWHRTGFRSSWRGR
jgi:hypothetical protein